MVTSSGYTYEISCIGYIFDDLVFSYSLGLYMYGISCIVYIFDGLVFCYSFGLHF